MCGFCGIIDLREGQEISQATLRRMTSILSHRGPDDEGIYISKNKKTGLGHRRLSIIDLSPAGHQPMSNEDGSIWITFNGEIYNFKDLRVELEQKGRRFKSQSDTEVIIHLYEEYGDGCVEHLRGMFSFAIWDEKREMLFIARDRLGIKPLFYFHKNALFVFASEIKAVLQHPEIAREICPHALDCYITFGYIPAPLTLFRDIYKLLPASVLSFKESSVLIKRYWELDYTGELYGTEEEMAGHLLNELKESVKYHRISDVPIGVFLSGGMDSSTITALVAEETGKPIETFSLGFGKDDELDYAKSVAERYRTNHHEFIVTPDEAKFLPEIVWFLDEPLFDTSIIPTYLISRHTRKHVKVVLSGDGGDELFAGYQWTRRYEFYRQYNRLPSFIRSGLNRIFLERKAGTPYGTGLLSKARRFLMDTTLSLEDGFARRTSINPSLKEELYSEKFKHMLKGYNPLDGEMDYFGKARVKDEREKMLFVDTMMYLPDDILFKVDRMSMAHSLEVRVPLLDHKVVEFASRIPFELKIKGFKTKYILKKTVGGMLPKKILKQRKQGFTLPFGTWLRRELKEEVSSLLLSKEFEGRGLFNVNYIRHMIEDHTSGRQDLSHRIMGLLVFEIWARLFIDRRTDDIPAFTLGDMI